MNSFIRVWLMGLYGLSLLAGCSELKPADWRGKGLQAVVEKPFSLPPDAANVYMQDGKLTDYDHANVYRPHCNLIFDKRLPEAREIAVQTCSVKGGGERSETAQIQGALQVASKTVMSDSGGDSQLAQIYITYYYLTCPQTRDFRQIQCRLWDDPITGKYLTLEQINTALAPYVQIR